MGRFEEINEISIHFSSTLGAKIKNDSGQVLGKLCDYFVDYEELYPKVLALQYKQNGQLYYIEWNDVLNFSFKEITVKTDCPIGQSRTYPKVKEAKVITSLLANQFSGKALDYPSVGKVILDRQIVDTSGKKVVRVNDIQFIRTGNDLRVTHAAVGLKSMMRRLGYDQVLGKILKSFPTAQKFWQKDSLINWKYVHAIPTKNIQNSNVKLNLSNEDLQRLHPADLADIIEDLDGFGREAILGELEPKLAAETLQEVEQDVQTNILKSEDPKTAAELIENMNVDDAADVLNELGDAKAKEIISHIKDEETKKEIEELQNYPEDQAGGIMSTEYFEVQPHWLKEQIIEHFKKEFKEIENIYDVFVTDDDENLLGVCPVQNLLLADEKASISQFMQAEDIKSVLPGAHWEDVAEYMNKYNLINVPVIDESNKLLGIISADDIMTLLLEDR